MKNGFERYIRMLIREFKKMSPLEQEQLIEKFAMILTVGATCLVILTFYPFIPRFYRYVALPLMLLAAWWSGRKIAAPAIKWLKSDPRDPQELNPIGLAIIAIGLLVWLSVGVFTHCLH